MSVILVVGTYATYDQMGTYTLHKAHSLFGSTSNVFHIDVIVTVIISYATA